MAIIMATDMGLGQAIAIVIRRVRAIQALIAIINMGILAKVTGMAMVMDMALVIATAMATGGRIRRD